MWHITSAEVFSDDNFNQPLAIIRREAGGLFAVEVQPERILPESNVQPSEDGKFASFEEALTFCGGN